MKWEPSESEINEVRKIQNSQSEVQIVADQQEEMCIQDVQLNQLGDNIKRIRDTGKKISEETMTQNQLLVALSDDVHDTTETMSGLRHSLRELSRHPGKCRIWVALSFLLIILVMMGITY